ncbi:hypothetical protein GCM10011608_12550 [Micromonospora sonchi]|uniref:XRE family transcriptional regulator n=1 Tax=Micromonospora sonchi TaxID=1763543 RepID=A0A917TMQ5_9ACTN|nr:helix-turn-helix transcriptional regulator [Micromonospora sonchi]GGM29379.1 hypothetical protein GCM10011608_12550 [Micromonospora sonchi]
MGIPTSAHQIARGLLDDPTIVQALTTRTFSVVFSAAKAAGLSYNAIATATGIKPERVSLIAHGKATITGIDTVERIADGLHIPGGMLGLAARSWENSTTGPQSRTEDASMHRRQLLHGALAAGLTTTALKPITEILTNATKALTASSGPATLAHLHTVTEQHSYGYAGRAPATVLANLVADVADLTALLQRPQPATTRIDLSRLMAQLGGMTAIVLHDLGHRRQALTWFTTAARAADEAGDRTLHAWVLARTAMVPLNYGAPAAAARLAEQARHTAGNAPTAAAALATAVAARAHALTGNRHQANTNLRAADRIAEALPDTERADTWLGHCDQKHHVHLSHALTTLGDTTHARTSQAQALALSAPTSTLTRTLLHLDAATCHHHDGNTLDACHAATNALTAIPATFHTGLIHSRATELYRAIPTTLRTNPAAQELADILTTTAPRDLP